MSSFIKQVDGSYAEVGSVGVGDIAGKVIDDTQSITIPVSGVPVKCEDYFTESGCTDAGCYWYDGACHGKPKVPPVEIPWAVIIAAVGSVVVIIGAIIAIRR